MNLSKPKFQAKENQQELKMGIVLASRVASCVGSAKNLSVTNAKGGIRLGESILPLIAIQPMLFISLHAKSVRTSFILEKLKEGSVQELQSTGVVFQEKI